jgi:hypothetical protein
MNALMREQVVETRIADESYLEGHVRAPILLGCEDPLASHGTISTREVKVDLAGGKALLKLDEKTKEWLREWADFFLYSEGFAQR